jgi:hypothetical protein
VVEVRGWWIVLDAVSWVLIAIVFGIAVFSACLQELVESLAWVEVGCLLLERGSDGPAG